MGWIGTVVGLIFSGSACFAYATGFDAVIYRTIMNWTSDLFVYLIAKGLEYFVSTIELLPDYSFENYQQAAVYVLSALSVANTVFPIVELVRSLVFVCAFYLILILIRIIFKLIPTLGG